MIQAKRKSGFLKAFEKKKNNARRILPALVCVVDMRVVNHKRVKESDLKCCKSVRLADFKHFIFIALVSTSARVRVRPHDLWKGQVLLGSSMPKLCAWFIPLESQHMEGFGELLSRKTQLTTTRAAFTITIMYLEGRPSKKRAPSATTTRALCNPSVTVCPSRAVCSLDCLLLSSAFAFWSLRTTPKAGVLRWKIIMHILTSEFSTV